jgi:two-component system sensor kinase FixL
MLLGRTKRMNSLVDGILRYSRVTRQHEETSHGGCQSIAAGSVRNCFLRRLAWWCTLRPASPPLQCERTRLTQVFENLISNAIKYMGKPAGEINIGCEDAGAYWKFHVRDTGPGIEEKYYEKIFQIFQTLAARDERESTGIGLAIVKKNVELSADGLGRVQSRRGQHLLFHDSKSLRRQRRHCYFPARRQIRPRRQEKPGIRIKREHA